MLNVKNLSKTFVENVVLENINMNVSNGEIKALVGPNGCGKSTFIKCISGQMIPSGGTVNFDKSSRVSVINQEFEYDSMTAFEFLMTVKKDIYNLYSHMNSENLTPEEYSNLISDYSWKNGYELESRIISYMGKFEFSEEILSKKVSEFSEGQKRFLEIARVQLSDSNFLIMDEPTNHLDISLRIKLEQMILEGKHQGKSYLIVSHDRQFIDNIADSTVYIDRGKSIEVTGGYTNLIEFLDWDYKTRKKKAEDISKKIKQLEGEVMRRRNWSNSREKDKFGTGAFDRGHIGAQAAKMMKKALNAQHRKEKEVEKLKDTKPFVEKKLNLSFPEYHVADRKVLSAENISFGYTENDVINDVSFELRTTDRVALIGANGSGKTTFMKCLLGELHARTGEITRNDSVKTMYIPQNTSELFMSEILIENYDFEKNDETVVRQFLGAAKLRREAVLRKTSELSRGELMRAAIVKAILNNVDFLFMDEPTNHLDIESLQVLDQLFDEFPGGFFFISHDRSFIINNSDIIFNIQDGKLDIFQF